MVRKNTTVADLLAKGYDIHIAEDRVITRHLTTNECPMCSAYLEVVMFPTDSKDDYYCTECQYEISK